MPQRPAGPTQADIARSIRTLKAEGFEIIRVVICDERVSIEVADGQVHKLTVDDPEERDPWTM